MHVPRVKPLSIHCRKTSGEESPFYERFWTFPGDVILKTVPRLVYLFLSFSSRASVSGFSGRVSWCCEYLTLRKILNMLGTLHAKLQVDRNRNVNPLCTSYTVHWRIFPLSFTLSYISILCITSIRYLQGHFSSLSRVTKGIIVNYRERKRCETSAFFPFTCIRLLYRGRRIRHVFTKDSEHVGWVHHHRRNSLSYWITVSCINSCQSRAG